MKERIEECMRIFDRIDHSNLEQREWQLWLLALTVLVVFAAGMALVMYPTVFSRPVVLSGITMRKAFFGLCALSLLLVVYFVDRQMVIRQLRRQLAEEQRRITRFRQEASDDLLRTLPRLDHFRDRLVMEYRRAAITEQLLSMVLIELTPSRELMDTSEVGHGTTFEIYLPALPRNTAPRREASSKSAPLPRGSETVLLVEDEHGVRAMTAQFLKNQGYEVLVAANPEEAVQICQERPENVSLLLTDVVMPTVSGPQLAEHLAFLRPAMKVLFMSGYSEDALARYGVTGSGAGFLQKPFTRESLALKVREVLNSAFATPDVVPF